VGVPVFCYFNSSFLMYWVMQMFTYCNEFAGSISRWNFIAFQTSIHNSWLQSTTLIEF
jgi:hypothetical protein